MSSTSFDQLRPLHVVQIPPADFADALRAVAVLHRLREYDVEMPGGENVRVSRPLVAFVEVGECERAGASCNFELLLECLLSGDTAARNHLVVKHQKTA